MAQVMLRSAWQTAEKLTNGNKTDYHDLELNGLMLEVRGPGLRHRTWYVRYRSENRQRQVRLGRADQLNYSQASILARQRLGTGRVAPGCSEFATAPTFSEFANSDYLAHARLTKTSWATDESLLRNHLLPRFGDKRLNTITRQDIFSLVRERLDAGAAPGSADRLVILLRYMFNLAIRWNIPGITDNPARAVPLQNKDNKRERYLTSEEIEQLFDALEKSDAGMLRYIVAFLLLTGARKREVLQARWEDFDFERRSWRIPYTKLQKPRYVPLSDGALQLLEQVPRYPKVAWVFPNPRTERPFVQIFYAWDTARKRAGLPDVRIHDLRHSFASILINAGRSIYEVQKLLGHTQIKTTQRYAHLAPDTLRNASNVAGTVIEPVLLGWKKSRSSTLPISAD